MCYKYKNDCYTLNFVDPWPYTDYTYSQVESQNVSIANGLKYKILLFLKTFLVFNNSEEYWKQNLVKIWQLLKTFSWYVSLPY